MQILYSFGSLRPDTLVEVEGELWKAIMRIVSGSDAETELQDFLRRYDEIKKRWEAQGIHERSLNFYDNGTFIQVFI
jgi:hypothetical protein